MIASFEVLLAACTVRISTSTRKTGTGFFVAPGRVLTCAHVVGEPDGRQPLIDVAWRGQGEEGRIEKMLPDPIPRGNIFPDLALLKIGRNDHPCVLLDPDF